jgi:hypothetical protein
MSDAATKICTGCQRELPADTEHFDRSGRGLRPHCKKCRTAQRREADGDKQCVGPCGRTLPRDDAHFALGKGGRQLRRCRECVLAAELAAEFERAAKRIPRPTTNLEREAANRERRARRKATEEREAEEREAAKRMVAEEREAAKRMVAAFEEAVAPLYALTDELPAPTPPDLSSPEGRAAALRRQASRRALRESLRPNFDPEELFLDMATDAGDVEALGASLRRAFQ